MIPYLYDAPVIGGTDADVNDVSTVQCLHHVLISLGRSHESHSHVSSHKLVGTSWSDGQFQSSTAALSLKDLSNTLERTTSRSQGPRTKNSYERQPDVHTGSL